MRYLLDTNVIIEYLSDMLPAEASLAVRKLPVYISVVTKMEILGWYKVNAPTLQQLEKFINQAYVVEINNSVVSNTIYIRQQHKIKLPDAIIAATAIATSSGLVTHNTKDFREIANLKLFDSHDFFPS